MKKAFPGVTKKLVHSQAHSGYEEIKLPVNLRDYFAAKAMQGYLNSPNLVDYSENTIACWSYEMADEMMKEREKK
jgi:hypothetical protein